MKIHPVGGELTNAEGRTDTDRQTDRSTDRETDRQTDRIDEDNTLLAHFANARKSCSHECGLIFVSVVVTPYKTRS